QLRREPDGFILFVEANGAEFKNSRRNFFQRRIGGKLFYFVSGKNRRSPGDKTNRRNFFPNEKFHWLKQATAALELPPLLKAALRRPHSKRWRETRNALIFAKR